jgi:hypothetical protein
MNILEMVFLGMEYNPGISCPHVQTGPLIYRPSGNVTFAQAIQRIEFTNYADTASSARVTVSRAIHQGKPANDHRNDSRINRRIGAKFRRGNKHTYH